MKGSNNQSTFQGQQGAGYNAAMGTQGAETNFYNTLTGMFQQQFGNQGNTIGHIQSALGPVLQGGPWMPGQNAPIPGNQYGGGAGQGGGSGGGFGGGGGGGSSRGGGGEGGGGGNSALNGIQNNPLTNYGFDPSAYSYQPTFSGAKQLRDFAKSDASEQVAQSYEHAQEANQLRMQQLGMGGVAGQEASNAQYAQAGDEAAGQREAYMKYFQMKNDNSRLAAQIMSQEGIAKGDAEIKAAGIRESQWAQQAQDQTAIAVEAMRSRTAKGIAAGQRAMAAAQLASENARFYAGLSSENGRFYSGLQSSNFFQGLSALSGTAQMQNPDYLMQGALSGMGQAGNLGLGIYDTASRGMQQPQQSGFWSRLLSSGLGGLMGGGQNGMGGMLQNYLNSRGGSPSNADMSGGDMYGPGFGGWDTGGGGFDPNLMTPAPDNSSDFTWSNSDLNYGG